MKVEELNHIQANILRPHGRNHVRCLFIRFGAAPADIREWIGQMKITSAADHQEESKRYAQALDQNEPYNGALVTCFALSAAGYAKIDLPRPSLPADSSFRLGMKHGIIRQRLQDPAPPAWEAAFQHGLDAVILLADNSEERLHEQVGKFKETLDGVGEIVTVQKGRRLSFGNYSIEPFGFRDDISEPPLWSEKKIRGRITKVPRRENWDLVLDENLGSYLVFRKLEQDVQAFNNKIIALAEQLNISRELAEAQVVGRFKDGTPLTLAPQPARGVSEPERRKIEKFNRFDPDDPNRLGYENDSQGVKCPFHAHIRKANPRSNALLQKPYADPKIAFKAMLTRRGIPYDEPGNGVGLLFMCYQRSIRFQFEVVQSQWANNPAFPINLPAGIDPLTGQGNETEKAGQRWNKDWGKTWAGREPFDFREVVCLKGGEYFYAPSLPFLQSLATGTRGLLSQEEKIIGKKAYARRRYGLATKVNGHFPYTGKWRKKYREKK